MRSTSVALLFSFALVVAGAARADRLSTRAARVLLPWGESRSPVGRSAHMEWRGHVLSRVDLADHRVLGGAVEKLRAGLDRYADALARHRSSHSDARHLRIIDAQAVYLGPRLTGYELTIITHNGSFPVRSTVNVAPDGALPPLFASSSDASDGVFGGRWMGWSNEALRDLHTRLIPAPKMPTPGSP